jgi:hypothetical protein
MTGKEMCEVIARWLKEVHKMDVKPKDIWEISPTGELWEVFYLFEQARAHFAEEAAK